jgi:hypothetical protein
MTDRRWLTRVISVAVVSVIGVFFVFAWGLVIVTNSFDPAYVLGVSDALLIAITYPIVGFITGILVALSGGVRGRLMLTVGLIGAGVYLAVSPIAMVSGGVGWLGAAVMWAAVVTGCVLATRWAYQKTHPTPTEKDNEPKVLVA